MKIFEELDVEKRNRIINAGMEEFGTYGFKHANTEEIARKAGIFKGLLFYYFKNKQSFFLYLFTFCEEITLAYINMSDIIEVDDFYELLRHGANKKVALLKEYPYCMDFIIQAWFSSQDGVIDILSDRMNNILGSTWQTWFKNIRTNRFKDDIDPMQIVQMLSWMMQGYLNELKLTRQPFNIDMLMDAFCIWEDMFKKMTYKEEFL